MPPLPPLTLAALQPNATSLITAAGSGADPASVLAQYGVLGMLVLVLGPFAYQAYRRELRRGDRAEEKLDLMQTYIRDQVVPALIGSANANLKAAEAQQLGAESVREMTVLLHDLTRDMQRRTP